LLQGINARIIALENRGQLEVERELRLKLSTDIQLVVGAIKESYQDVMRRIVCEVESITEKVEHRTPHFALMEVDEQFIYQNMSKLVNETNKIFNDGLKVDELFGRLESVVRRILETVKEPSENTTNNKKPPEAAHEIELF
jgi:hypothetical protein